MVVGLVPHRKPIEDHSQLRVLYNDSSSTTLLLKISSVSLRSNFSIVSWQLGRVKGDPNWAALHWASGASRAYESVEPFGDRRRFDPLMFCDPSRS